MHKCSSLRHTSLRLLTLLLFASLSMRSMAVGMGEITLHSHLHQPLKATIDLHGFSGMANDEIIVELADKAQHDRFDLPNYLLNQTLRFKLVFTSKEKAHIEVTSLKPINEPFLSFVVNLETITGKKQKAYSVVIDPPAAGE